jgi:hypothetical protein
LSHGVYAREVLRNRGVMENRMEQLRVRRIFIGVIGIRFSEMRHVDRAKDRGRAGGLIISYKTLLAS